MIEATVLHRSAERPAADLERWNAAMKIASEAAYGAYRRLVEHPSLVPYFLTATPGGGTGGAQDRLTPGAAPRQ